MHVNSKCRLFSVPDLGRGVHLQLNSSSVSSPWAERSNVQVAQDKSKEKLRDKVQEEEKLRQQFQKRLRHVLDAGLS